MTLAKRLAAEGLGTALLLCAIVGSGIMAQALTKGNAGLALLANSLATGGALVCLIAAFAPVSGAHFNPVVSLSAAFSGEISWREAAAYGAMQIAGACVGAIAANLMFGLPAVNLSGRIRSGPGLWLGEFIATLGLLLVIRLCARYRASALPVSVAAYIVGAYWFTSSTSFANPAVTIARSLSDTFAGIRPADIPWFILAQFAGCAAATLITIWLLSPPKEHRARETQGLVRLHPQ
ncbi:MAG TPA: MIP/aquaporin family protein [Candidatus Acidoferrales bacterium]|nr:MIP/aquaporin family protein [Candidatus Acidoferrales bacterium]